MERKLLHIYRNTPLGRETLLQSIWFCQKVDCNLAVYVPSQPQFLIFLERSVVTMSLDASYLRDGDLARERARSIATEQKQRIEFVEPIEFTAPTLPNLAGKYRWMACPRSMSELSSKIRFGHLGPRVRSIVNSASFPVLLPTPVFKPWHSIVACYGGSENSARALNRAYKMSLDCRVPLSIFTFAEGKSRRQYEELLSKQGLLGAIEADESEWIFCESGSLESNLFSISRDSLVVLGAYGHGVIRETLFGSKLESVQTEVPNNLLIVGPEVPSLADYPD